MFTVDNNKTYAVVGASSDYTKYGYKVLFDLLDSGFKVFAVNPKGGLIEDVLTYKSLKEIPEKIDVVVFVVPPIITEKVLETVNKLNIKKVWMQPGSSSEDAVSYCEKYDIDCMHDVCVMIQKKIN